MTSKGDHMRARSEQANKDWRARSRRADNRAKEQTQRPTEEIKLALELSDCGN